MNPPETPNSVVETLREAQCLGLFGAGDIRAAVRHAQGFVAALGPLAPGVRVVDLGSGGGLPGLVLAASYPDVAIVLLDRRQKRTDFLERAVQRHGWPHVVVRCADVRELIAGVRTGETEPFDVVTARGFGPPDFTVRSAVAVCRPGGRIAISEPPMGDRWPAALLDRLDLTSVRSGPVRVFERSKLDRGGPTSG